MVLKTGQATMKDVVDEINNKVSFSEPQTLTEEQKLQARTNIGAGAATITVVQTTGTSTTSVMSQNAVTTALNGKADVSALNQKANTSGSYANFIAGALNGKNVVTDQTITSLTGGKIYINCVINASSFPTGTSYFYGCTFTASSVSFLLNSTVYLISCTGNISVPGISSTVYVSNSPSLKISGITSSNWTRVWIDGTAKYKTDAEIYMFRTFSGLQIVTGIANIPTPSSKYTWTYPVAFTNSPNVTVTPLFGAGGNTYVEKRSGTEAIIAQSSDDTDYFMLSAIGLWK